MLLFFHVISTEPLSLTKFPQTKWRNILMKLVLEDISTEGMLYLSHGRPASDYCDRWMGITCHKKKIDAIRLENFMHGNFNIHALPPSTVQVHLVRCRQAFEIHIRSVPQNLEVLEVPINAIFGNLDFTAFPPRLQRANFEYNRISGYINLTQLPRTLRILYVGGNRFRQHTVWYDDLPEHGKMLSLVESYDTENIYEVRSVDPEKKVKDRSIFAGIRLKHIH